MFSIQMIPWWSFWGLDLQNMFTYHHCSTGLNNPYLVDGTTCGDALGRGMIYPPVLYWSFVWVRLFEFDWAVKIWSAFIFLGTVFSFRAWLKKGQFDFYRNFYILVLLAQMPLVFAIERGNNDIWVLVLWSLGFYLFNQNRNYIAGLILGLASVSKVYPFISLGALALGYFWVERSDLRKFKSTFLGAFTSIFLLFFIFYQQSFKYFFEILPAWSQVTAGLPGFSHTQAVLFGDSKAPHFFVSLFLLGAWIYRVTVELKSDPAFVFAGLLGISTYFGGVSFDYNLITVFPLVFILLDRALKSQNSVWDWTMLNLGVVAVFIARIAFPKLSVALQIYWLLALAIGRQKPKEPKLSEI